MRELVAAQPVARFASLAPDGRAQLVPICFALDGDRLWSAVDAKPKRTQHLGRLANIARDPRVTLLIDHYEEDWERVWWVRLDGLASVAEERRRGVELLMDRYPQYRSQPPAGPVIEVAITRWIGWTGEP